jgi:hypothetical protein
MHINEGVIFTELKNLLNYSPKELKQDLEKNNKKIGAMLI